MWLSRVLGGDFKPTLLSYIGYVLTFIFIVASINYGLLNIELANPINNESRIRGALFGPIFYIWLISFLFMIYDAYTYIRRKLRGE